MFGNYLSHNSYVKLYPTIEIKTDIVKETIRPSKVGYLKLFLK